MNHNLQFLRKLQEIQTESQKIAKTREALPGQIEILTKAFELKRQELQDLKAKLHEAEKDRRAKELALKSQEEKAGKLASQQFLVKTNKEFEAIKSEIAFLKENNGHIEESIYLLMDQIEQAKKEIAEREEGFKAVESGFAKAKEEKQAILTDLDREWNRVMARREEIVGKLSSDFVELFDNLVRRRDGLAVVTCREEVCQGCNMQIRLQLWSELLGGQEIIQCPHCHRILFPERA